MSPNEQNGYDYDNYRWTQTLKEIGIHVKLPKGVTSKQLKVDISSKKLCIKNKQNDTVLLEGEFEEPITSDDTFWAIDDGVLQLEICKPDIKDHWWERLLKHEQKIDPQKFAPEDANVLIIRHLKFQFVFLIMHGLVY